MRARLKETDIQFVLGLLRREKEEFGRQTEYLKEEKKLLDPLLRVWRQKLRYSYFKHRDGYFFIKRRLAYLENLDYSHELWQYRRALDYLIHRYEAMLRGKSGRPLGVSEWGFGCLKDVVEGKINP